MMDQPILSLVIALVAYMAGWVHGRLSRGAVPPAPTFDKGENDGRNHD